MDEMKKLRFLGGMQAIFEGLAKVPLTMRSEITPVYRECSPPNPVLLTPKPPVAVLGIVTAKELGSAADKGETLLTTAIEHGPKVDQALRDAELVPVGTCWKARF